MLLFGIIYLLNEQRVNINSAVLALVVAAIIEIYTLLITPCEAFEIEPYSFVALAVLIYLVFTLNVRHFVHSLFKSKKLFLLIFTITVLDLLFAESFIGILFPPLKKYSLSSIYLEPSHSVVYLLPFLMLSSVWAYKKIKIIPNIFLLMNFSSSAAVVMFFINIKHYKIFVGLIGIATLAFLFYFDIENMFDQQIKRNSNEILLLLLLQAESLENLTILVFLSGWVRSYELYQAGLYFGEGFNLMGCSGIVDQYQEIIFSFEKGYLNIDDGSFLFAKIASEFGIFSILFLLSLVLSIFVYSAINIFNPHRDRYWFAFIVILFFTMFLRNPGGYFSLPALLCLASLVHIVKEIVKFTIYRIKRDVRG